MDPLPVMNKVFSIVLQFEREFCNLDKEIHQDMATMVRRPNGFSKEVQQNFGHGNFHSQSSNANMVSTESSNKFLGKKRRVCVLIAMVITWLSTFGRRMAILPTLSPDLVGSMQYQNKKVMRIWILLIKTLIFRMMSPLILSCCLPL